MRKMRSGEEIRKGARTFDSSDPWIWAVVGLLVLCGIVFVYSTTYFYASFKYGDSFRLLFKHGISVAVGFALLLLCSRCGSDLLAKAAPLLMLVSMALLACTMISGLKVCANNACRWIPLGPMQFQPAEPIKIAFVIAVAAWLSRYQDKLHKPLYGLIPPLALLGVISLMLIKQPDFGTTALLGVLCLAMMFLGGVPLLQVFSLTGLLGAVGGMLVWTSEYRRGRILSWGDALSSSKEIDVQGAGWQLHQAKIAFGSGRLEGIGLGASTQKSGWLPEAHTDFIFSVVGEETGLIGAVLVLLLFALLVWRGLRLAERHHDEFAQLVAAGITLVVVIQAMINMGVVLGLLPTKGIGLPFISYGGSSIMVFLAATGILMSLSRELRER